MLFLSEAEPQFPLNIPHEVDIGGLSDRKYNIWFDEGRVLFRMFFLMNMFINGNVFRDTFNSADLLSSAISTAKKRGIPLTWSIFAIQSFVDMHLELGDDVQRGFQDLQGLGEWAIPRLQYLSYRQATETPEATKSFVKNYVSEAHKIVTGKYFEGVLEPPDPEGTSRRSLLNDFNWLTHG